MRIKESEINKYLIILLTVSALIRGFLAYFIEFGNDEVYYWTYAMYPDWSHFDHPPMVGWFIQLFSGNLLFTNEFFLRLSSVICMTSMSSPNEAERLSETFSSSLNLAA